MKTEYDSFTKDKEISYLGIIDDIMINKLGFRLNNGGTRYLRKLIIYLYKNDKEEYSIDAEIKNFIKEKKLSINPRSFRNKIDYAVNNLRIDKVKKNFEEVFGIKYDPMELTVKNIVDTIMFRLYKNNKI